MKGDDILTAQRARSRPKWHRVGVGRLRAAVGFSLGGLLVLTVLTGGFAQTAAPSGEELYVDRLGCWNCHGTAGRGGEAHSIAQTQLPLRRFIKHVRLPSGSMPPVPAVLASDGELAAVYQWLGGIDAVKAPPLVALDLKAPSRVSASGPALVEAKIDLGVASPESKRGTDSGAAARHFRITLVTAANVPLADQAVEYQPGGRGEWSTFTLDGQGEALLGPDRILADARGTQKNATTIFRMTLPTGRYALVVEVVDRTEAANPIVVGVGTAILKVE